MEMRWLSNLFHDLVYILNPQVNTISFLESKNLFHKNADKTKKGHHLNSLNVNQFNNLNVNTQYTHTH